MNIKIIKNSSTELEITQQKKLTFTGFVFCLPAIMMLFNMPDAHGLLVLFIACLLWLIIMFGFYKGVTSTVKAERINQVLKLSVKGIQGNKKISLRYDQIDHVLMAESSPFLNMSRNYQYHIIIEKSDRNRIKLFGFKDRQLCKDTMALIESHLY